jgi:hypothetical protein
MKNVHFYLILFIFASLQIQSKGTTFFAHVYVQNYTNIKFNVSIEYRELVQKTTVQIPPLVNVLEPCSTNLVLTFDKTCSIGEHIYSVKLDCNNNVIQLKQKLASTDQANISTLFLSIDQYSWHNSTNPLTSPIYYQKIAGRDVAICYTVKNNYSSDDIIYAITELNNLQEETPRREDFQQMPLKLSVTVKTSESCFQQSSFENTLSKTTFDFLSIANSKNMSTTNLLRAPKNSKFFGNPTEYSLRYIILMTHALSHRLKQQTARLDKAISKKHIIIQNACFEYSKIFTTQPQDIGPKRALAFS